MTFNIFETINPKLLWISSYVTPPLQLLNTKPK